MQVRGRRVKAVAEASKNGYLYILDRETGKPVHPIKEMPVPTDNAGPGQEPWPTQPIPFTASGKPMEPVCPIEPTDIPAEQLAKNRPVPIFSPMRPNQIIAPGTGGGTNYSPLAYSPRTGLLYVNAIDQPYNSGRGPKGYFSAYDPTTGELKWRQVFEGFGQAGSVVTAKRPGVCRDRQQHRRVLLRVRREDRRAAVEVQYRGGCVLVAVDVHGQRRAVRHGRVRRRRARTARRRSHSELRAAS